MAIPTLIEQTNIKLTPSGLNDKVTAEELRYVCLLIIDELRTVGVLRVDTTAELQTKTSSEALFIYVKSVGFFQYTTQGTVNNSTTFPSSDGGVWTLSFAAGTGGNTGGGGDDDDEEPPAPIDLSAYVLKTRKINGMPLSDDIDITKESLDLENVANLPPASYPVSIATNELVNTVKATIAQLQATVAAQATQIATLQNALATKANLINGKVPSAELPGYVSDVLEFNTKTDFPAVGSADKLYLAKDEPSKLYRWSGSVYVNIGGGSGGTMADVYFVTTEGQRQVTLNGTINKYVPYVRISSDAGWKIIHDSASTALAADEVRHNAATGVLTFGSDLPDSSNNVVIYQ